MAEAASMEFSFFRQCIFCNAKLSDEYQVRKHLEEVHGISGNTTISDKKYNFEAVRKPDRSTKASNKNLHQNDKIKLIKNILKENFPKYLEILKLWIRCELSSADFDQEARAFFTSETIGIHNEFLISFMQEIRSITKGSKLKFRSKIHFLSDSDVSFASSSTDFISCKEKFSVPMQGVGTSGHSGEKSFHATKHTSLRNSLPDFETLCALIHVNAYDSDCCTVDKSVVSYIRNAAEAMIRNILSTLNLRRNKSTMTVDECNGENEESFQKSTEKQTVDNSEEITLQELFECLEAQTNLIPMKSVYMCNLQRIIKILKEVKMGMDASGEQNL